VHGVNGAIVVLHNRDASIAAMVGGRDYGTSSFNRAVYAKRQVGSIAKPLWAALAMEQDSTLLPGCWIQDKELALGSGQHRWVPQNYDRKFLGAISLRDALRTSRNIPFVHLYEQLKEQKGNAWMSERFDSLGLSIPPYPSAVLGSFVASPLDVARAYMVFSNDGFLPSGTRWVSSHANFLAVDMMRSVMIDGTGRSIASYAPQRYFYGKSGTTDGARDAWFVGYDKEYTIAVWVGFDKEKALGLGGSVAALPIFGRFVDAAGLGQKEISKPRTIVFQDFCQDAPLCTTKEPDLAIAGRTHNSKCSLGGEQIFQEEKKGFWASIFPF
jgi:membrane carboxypeptidase/penicillin-binding protein